MIVSVDDPVPTVGGILVLGNRPQDFLPGAYAQFLRVAGTEFGDSVADSESAGVQSRTSCGGSTTSSSHTTARPSISCPGPSRSAIRPTPWMRCSSSCVTRSCTGPTKTRNAPTHVYWFDDRIEIGSPGGPYGVVNAGNFGQPGVVDYRNPILTEAMRVLGLVQRYGFGIPAARRLLRAAGHPEPEFRVHPNRVHCTVRARA